MATNWRVSFVGPPASAGLTASSATVGVVGVTAIEVRPITFKVPLPTMEPEVAKTWTDPAPTAVASPAVAPAVLTVAIEAVLVLHATVAVKF